MPPELATPTEETAPHRSHARLFIALAAVVLAGIVLALVFSKVSGDLLQRRMSEANALFNANDTSAAVAKADSILTRDPRNITALLLKAASLAQKGSLEFKETTFGPQAIAIAQEALALDPRNSEAYRIIGYAYEIMQKYDEAHAAYEKALALDPSNVAAVSQNAHAYDLQGQIEKAEVGYRAALALDQNFSQAQMGLGRIFVQKGQLDEALARFTRVAGTAQNARVKAEAAYSAGSISSARGNRAEAERFMRLATVTDQKYALGWVGLGKELFDQSIAASSQISLGQRNALITSSMDSLQKAIAINPNQSLAHYQLGIQLAALGKTSAAVKILTEAKSIVASDITLSTTGKTTMLAKIDSALAVVSAARK